MGSKNLSQQPSTTSVASTSIPGKRLIKIVILSASSGSGHTRAAEALEAAAVDLPGIASIRHIDVLDYASSLFGVLYSDLYAQLVSKAPSLWGWWYAKSDTPWKGEGFRIALERFQMQPLPSSRR